MKQKLQLHYYNVKLQIGLVNLKTVYLLKPKPTLLLAEVYRGKLVYRAKGSSKRISYDQIKKGLLKKVFWIVEEVPDWLQ